MKAFEKWLKGKAGIGWYQGTEEGWKAALEWIIAELDKARDGFQPDEGLRKMVEKELHGKTL
jgi:hypothetical protein